MATPSKKVKLPASLQPGERCREVAKSRWRKLGRAERQFGLSLAHASPEAICGRAGGYHVDRLVYQCAAKTGGGGERLPAPRRNAGATGRPPAVAALPAVSVSAGSLPPPPTLPNPRTYQRPPLVEDLLLWRDVPKSAAALGAATLLYVILEVSAPAHPPCSRGIEARPSSARLATLCVPAAGGRPLSAQEAAG
jgi:hypothetical protein